MSGRWNGRRKLQIPPRAEYIRVITSELNRISSHLVWWGAFLMDLGGFTPMLYAFDDREKILDVLEGITGSRLTYSYYRIGGLYNDVDDAFIQGTRAFVAQMRPRLKMYRALVTDNIILQKRLIGIGPISKEMCRKYGATGPVIRGSGIQYDVRKVEPYSAYPEFDFFIPVFEEGDFIKGTRAFVAQMRPRLKMYRALVTDNIILRKRLIGIGPISKEMCRKYGASGPVIRGSGIQYDVRKVEPYSAYPEFDFFIPTFEEGDSMARYLVHMEEMAQSLRIIEQALDKLPAGPVMAEKVPRVLKLPPGDYCYAVEAARGRFAVRIVSDNKEIPYRVKLRTPCLSNLSLFEEASQGMLLPDALALLGSLDLVIPDIDR